MTCAVYRIVCVPDEERCYVGGTVDIKRRWKEHRSGLRAGKHSNSRLQAAWDRWGEASFRFSVVQECSSSDLRALEDATIQRYNSHNNGYNLSHLGAGLTTVGRSLLSERMRGKVQVAGLIVDAKSDVGRARRSETMRRLNATGAMRFKKKVFL